MNLQHNTYHKILCLKERFFFSNPCALTTKDQQLIVKNLETGDINQVPEGN